jgi:hypothetical protein
MVSAELGQLESKEQRLVRQIVIHFYFSALFHLPQSMERLRINSLVVTAAEDLTHHPAGTKLKIIFAVIDNFCIVLVAVLLGLVSVLALSKIWTIKIIHRSKDGGCTRQVPPSPSAWGPK